MSPETSTPNLSRIEQVHCNKCGIETRHDVVAERIQHGSETLDEDNRIEVSWRTRWTMLECRGCESVCLRQAYWFSEWDDSYQRGNELIEFFPPPAARRSPRWLEQLGEESQELLKETYVALHADSRRLAMMGARAIVDIVLDRDPTNRGTFRDRLEGLVSRGLVSTTEKTMLEAALEVGHAAAHRGHRATREDVDTVIDIIEHLLHAEVLGSAVTALRARTPLRPARTVPTPNHPSSAPDAGS
jgi:hypothetical protein